jgi:hypothetical protein
MAAVKHPCDPEKTGYVRIVLYHDLVKKAFPISHTGLEDGTLGAIDPPSSPTDGREHNWPRLRAQRCP